MKKYLESFKHLMATNKPGFLLLCVRLGVAFLFVISMLFPFFKMIRFDEVVNRISAIEFPGGWFFLILTLGLMGGLEHATLIENKKFQKLALLVQGIQASVVFLWGLIIFSTAVEEAKTYPNASCALGFGFTLQLIFIALLWFTTFGEKWIAPIIQKFIKEEKPAVPVEQPTVQ